MIVRGLVDNLHSIPLYLSASGASLVLHHCKPQTRKQVTPKTVRNGYASLYSVVFRSGQGKYSYCGDEGVETS